MKTITVEAMKRIVKTPLGDMETRSYLMRRTKQELTNIIVENNLSINKNLKKEIIVNKIMEFVTK